MFSFFRAKEESSILNLILQGRDLKVKERELSLCKKIALKNNLAFKRDTFEVDVTLCFCRLMLMARCGAPMWEE